jgi:hypothetical protein
LTLKASNPNAVFPEAKASAAVMAEPGPSWVESIFKDQQYHQSLRNPNDYGGASSSNLTAPTIESLQSGIVTRNVHNNVIHACVSTSILNPIKLSNRFAVLNRTVSFCDFPTIYSVEKTGYAKIYKKSNSHKLMYSTEQLCNVLPNISVVRTELAIYKATELRKEVCNLFNLPSVAAPSMIVVDSGAGVHLTDTSKVVQLEQAEPLKLHTANGKIISSTVTRNDLGEFFGDVEFRVTKKTPTVVSWSLN